MTLIEQLRKEWTPSTGPHINCVGICNNCGERAGSGFMYGKFYICQPCDSKVHWPPRYLDWEVVKTYSGLDL